MKFISDFIGFDRIRRTIYFSGSDTESKYNDNLKQLPDDWYYRDREISYTYNELGHRSRKISDLDFNNYILFLGDSYTEGIGLELETTYPYLTAKKLNMDYYNLGLGGAGLDIMFYNLSVWLTRFPKPKYISIYWSDPTRYLTFGRGDISQELQTCSHWSVEKDFLKMHEYGIKTEYFDCRAKLYVKMIIKMLKFYNIPHSNITFVDYNANLLPELKKFREIQNTWSCPYDFARDRLHVGIKHHNHVSDYLVSYYHDKYKDARDNQDTRGQI